MHEFLKLANICVPDDGAKFVFSNINDPKLTSNECYAQLIEKYGTKIIEDNIMYFAPLSMDHTVGEEVYDALRFIYPDLQKRALARTPKQSTELLENFLNEELSKAQDTLNMHPYFAIMDERFGKK